MNKLLMLLTFLTLFFKVNAQILTATDKNVKNDEWSDNTYRNTKYKFRVSFPKDWEYDKGTAKSTLARALHRGKGAVMAINIVHMPKSEIGIKVSNEQFKKGFLNALKPQNITPEVLEVYDGFLNNFPGRIISFKHISRTGTLSSKFFSQQIQCEIKGLVYSLSLNADEESIDEELLLQWGRFVESFTFEFYAK